MVFKGGCFLKFVLQSDRTTITSFGDMKKIILRLLGFVFVLALVAVAPRVYQLVLPVNSEASTQLSVLGEADAQKEILDCLAEQNRVRVWWDWNSAWRLKPIGRLIGETEPMLFVVAGILGHHVTWAAAVEYEASRFIAYETVGANRNTGLSMFRGKLPYRVIGSLKKCGVNYGGVYPMVMPAGTY